MCAESDHSIERPPAQEPDDHNELRLLESEVPSINETLWKSHSGRVPLPLPEQDHQLIQEAIRRNQRQFRISILETIGGLTLVCFVLALTNWLSLPLLTLGLGCATVCLLLGFFDSFLGQRYRAVITWLMLISYLLAAIIALTRTAI